MILGILQARMSSTRLPGKVMMPLLGEPMLARQVERLRRAERVDRLMIATSVDPSDDAVAGLARELGLEVYRGSLDDVLDRYYQAAATQDPSHVVRLTADCPLADWALVDRAIDCAVGWNFDYASNTIRPTWPDGLDVEVMTYSALQAAAREATDPVEREHVTQFLIRRPDRFAQGSLEADVDLSAMRWTVDEPSDFDFVTRVYETLYAESPAFTTRDILHLLRQQPDLLNINGGIGRNEGLLRSIEKSVKEQPIG